MKTPELITSRQNPTVKWLASLCEKKYRDREGCFLADGEKLYREAVRAAAQLTHILLRQDRDDLLPAAMAYAEAHRGCEVLRLSEACFEKITTEKSPQGIIVVIKYLDNLNNYYIIKKDAFTEDTARGILLLDGVRDPGNVGAVLRSAAAFGATDLILSADCADLYHPRTLRASMGAVFHLRLHVVADLPGAVAALRAAGRRVLAAELTPAAKSVFAVGLSSRDAVVIGNEGHCISPAVSSACDGSVYLPVSDAVESLNASVAASLFSWEQMRPCLADAEKDDC